MLESIQLQDVPGQETLPVHETTPLEALVSALDELAGVLVVSHRGPTGVVLRDEVLRHASRRPHLTVGLLPAKKAIELPADTSIVEAAHAVVAANAEVIVMPSARPRVVFREHLFGEMDHGVVLEAQRRREREAELRAKPQFDEPGR